MAYNLKLAERIRAELDGVPFVEKKMFGGVGFLIGGKMACGVYKEDLIVRVDPAKREKLLKKPAAKVFDITTDEKLADGRAGRKQNEEAVEHLGQRRC